MKISRGKSLDRYYLFKLFGYGIFLHKIHHSDPEGFFHGHPWNGLSIIFGSYWEVMYHEGIRCCQKKTLFNLVKAKSYHRVIIDKPVWTLFIHGKKCNKWSIINDAGEIIAQEPWEGEQGLKDYTDVGK